MSVFFYFIPYICVCLFLKKKKKKRVFIFTLPRAIQLAIKKESSLLIAFALCVRDIIIKMDYLKKNKKDF